MGYDLDRFNTQVDDEFLCVICKMVLENAVQSPQCEHSFCYECIKEWLLINSTCPVDRHPLKCDDLKPAARSLRNLLSKLEIKCDFESYGCNTTIKLENLQNHVNLCKFSPNMQITCDKGCGLKIAQKEYENHHCIAHLANLVIDQQKQISQLNAEVTILRKQQIWQKFDGITFNEQNIFELQNTKENDEIAQSSYPLTSQYFYFEIKILQMGDGNTIAIGLTRKEYPNDQLPGWGKGSIGYHSDDGRIFIESGQGKIFGPLWQTGDIIGCGIKFPRNFSGNENDTVKVYFTRNYYLIGEKSARIPNGGFFPTIGMDGIGDKVIVNLFPNNF